jgi:hypothetical protein
MVAKNLDPKTFYYDKMKNLNVQLAYKLGGFTDKDNIKVLTDSVSPGSTSGSKFIPDENYKILFRTSNPVESFNYSGVLIEKNTDVGRMVQHFWAVIKVLGYSTTKPYFKFNYPFKTTTNKISVAGSVHNVSQYSNYQETVQTIPYGYVFDTIQDVADFLFGYGHWLESQGFSFNKFSNELKETLELEQRSQGIPVLDHTGVGTRICHHRFTGRGRVRTGHQQQHSGKIEEPGREITHCWMPVEGRLTYVRSALNVWARPST